MDGTLFGPAMSVDAPDAETAIDKAIEELEIDPRIVEWLMAERR